jgi:two-component sensor histidine kinase
MNPARIETVHWAYPGSPVAARDARRRLAAQLQTWQVNAADAESVLLVTHELVTNAVEHARTPFELTVSFDKTAVLVEVSDESTLLPDLQPLNLRAARGRGLQMVAALAKSWNWISHTGGKTIRAVIVPES